MDTGAGGDVGPIVESKSSGDENHQLNADQYLNVNDIRTILENGGEFAYVLYHCFVMNIST